MYRALAVSEELDIVESVRLFAMTNMAADGSIGCWNDKYSWNFWRPITGEAASDGNLATVADPAWLPLFDPTVPFPGRRSSRQASSITPRGIPASAERPRTR